MEITKPIFILGIGRCGSTIFHDVMSQHERLAWFSSLTSTYPQKLNLNRRLLNLSDYPFLKKILRRKYPPVESYKFWNFYSKGFGAPFRDLTADDVTNVNKMKIVEALKQIPTRTRNKLLVKLTGWPRIRFIKEILPDAKFIHIVRDGRAVVNSMTQVHFWLGWRGPSNWRWGNLSEDQRLEWEKYDKSFIALAAIEWKIIMDAFEKAKKDVLTENYTEIKYEDFCEDTIGTLKKACDFSEVEFSSTFEKNIVRYKIKNSNTKWLKDLTTKQQIMLNEILGDHLKFYNYKI